MDVCMCILQSNRCTNASNDRPNERAKRFDNASRARTKNKCKYWQRLVTLYLCENLLVTVFTHFVIASVFVLADASSMSTIFRWVHFHARHISLYYFARHRFSKMGKFIAFHSSYWSLLPSATLAELNDNDINMLISYAGIESTRE